jgi:hypothetical protein
MENGGKDIPGRRKRNCKSKDEPDMFKKSRASLAREWWARKKWRSEGIQSNDGALASMERSLDFIFKYKEKQ